MNKKTIMLILATFLACGVCAQSQAPNYRSSYFYGTFKSRGGLAMGIPSGIISAFNPYRGDVLKKHPVLRWLSVSIEMDFHIPAWSMSQGGNDLPLASPRWWGFLAADLKHDYNFSYGYEISWVSKVVPVGAYIGIDYEWRQVCLEEGLLAGRHQTQAILPSAGIRVHLLGIGFERSHNWNIVLEGGASFNYATKYTSFFDWGRSAVNNGFRSRLGIAFSTQRFGAYYVRWEHDMYDFFNQNFSMPDGSKPFEGIRNDFNHVVFGWAKSM